MLHRLLSPLRNAVMSLSTKVPAPVPPTSPLIIVLGATGTGKSQLAIDLSLAFNGEIINGDAMQLYHGLPIVTNKVTPLETQNIPHHLLSEIPLSAEPWRVGVFKRNASRVIREIRERGKVPVLVGGTHYYTQSLVFGDSLVGEGEEKEGGMGMSFEEVNKKWPILDGGTEEMLELLREVDPIMAGRWHPKDRRKIRRSLEIYLMSGRKASDIYAEQASRKEMGEGDGEGEGGVDLSNTLFFWVHAESNVLKERLDGRIEKMLQSGMLEEVKSMSSYLSTHGNTIDRTRGIWVSIGWKEFEPYLSALNQTTTTTTKEELQILFDNSIEQIKVATRQYAKRQTRWIKLKLLPALKEQGKLKRIYLLDGTDISSFQSNVVDPAIEITTAFLEGKEMVEPESVCAAAKEVLGSEEEEGKGERDGWERKECEICGVVGVTKVQWITHLKSRKHRGALKRVQKRQRDGVRVRASREEVVSEGSSDVAVGTP